MISRWRSCPGLSSWCLGYVGNALLCFLSHDWVCCHGAHTKYKESGFFKWDRMLCFLIMSLDREEGTGAWDHVTAVLSQDTYRVRLNDSQEYRLFAASVKERNTNIYKRHRAWTPSVTVFLGNEMCELLNVTRAQRARNQAARKRGFQGKAKSRLQPV